MKTPSPDVDAPRRRLFARAAAVALSAHLPGALRAMTRPGPSTAECIVPAKAGGGFDLTCKVAKSLLDRSGALSSPVKIRYVPGGIGAIVYKQTIMRSSDRAEELIAFSGGSLLNIAQRKFGPYAEDSVRWVASLAMDFGVVAVHRDSPIRNFKDLVTAVRARPMEIVFGAGGTIGSQDWIKSAEIARAAQYDFKLLRYVAFEGGGDAVSALERGYVHVMPGDASELTMHLKHGAAVRVVASFSEERLPGLLASVPTAREQGFDIVWPVARGFYVGPRVDDAAYEAWVSLFEKVAASADYRELMNENGMQPYFLGGRDLTRYVTRQVEAYRTLARQYQLL